ncbi:MAG: CRISPR-associated protein Cas4 [Promethearchaeota archaeon]
MRSFDDENIEKYELNEFQLNDIRLAHPMINLYDKPFIGSEDIRQYIYCKRKIYFRYVVRAPMEKTPKMEFGSEKHEILQSIKHKIKDEEVISKYYNIYLTDPKLCLVGLIDYFEYDGKEAWPVEIKTGNPPPKGLEERDKAQVVAQALLIERNFNFLVKKVKIVYTKVNKIMEFPITIDDKVKVMNIIREIQDLIIKEEIPPPIKEEAKCLDCECRQYCLNG